MVRPLVLVRRSAAAFLVEGAIVGAVPVGKFISQDIFEERRALGGVVGGVGRREKGASLGKLCFWCVAGDFAFGHCTRDVLARARRISLRRAVRADVAALDDGENEDPHRSGAEIAQTFPSRRYPRSGARRGVVRRARSL